MSAGAPASEPAPLEEISREEIVRRRRDPRLVLVDVLPRASYEGGHIPGALSLPLAEVADRAKELLPDPGADIAVYCGSPT